MAYCCLAGAPEGRLVETQPMNERSGQETIRPDRLDLREQLQRRFEHEREAAARTLYGVPEFVLASASPRRRELLAALGLRFEVHAADLPEVARAGETPEQFVARVAREKAAHVASFHAGQRVLAADTIVAVGSTLLGKPRDRDHAREMLTGLSGTTHRVCTGVALVGAEGTKPIVVTTNVGFHPMTAAEIEAYIDSREPFDKAGAYGIQGEGGRFVRSLSGSYSNVVGLPLEETADLLSNGGRRS